MADRAVFAGLYSRGYDRKPGRSPWWTDDNRVIGSDIVGWRRSWAAGACLQRHGGSDCGDRTGGGTGVPSGAAFLAGREGAAAPRHSTSGESWRALAGPGRFGDQRVVRRTLVRGGGPCHRARGRFARAGVPGNVTMDVIHQEFRLPVRYPVYFTSGVFDVSNELLRDVVVTGSSGRPDVSESEDNLPAKMIVVLDRGVERAHPALVDAIGAYCDGHQAALTLSGPV